MSLVCAHELLHVHNKKKERNFLQAKLGSEKNASFFSNEPGDLYFLLHTFGVKIILFKLKKKKLCGRKKDIANWVLHNANDDLKNNDWENVLSQCHLELCDFSSN